MTVPYQSIQYFKQTSAMGQQRAGTGKGTSMPYLRRGALPPASKSVFESMALDGACCNSLRRETMRGEAATSPNLARRQIQSCHAENGSVRQQQWYPHQRKPKQMQNHSKMLQGEAPTKSFKKNCYLKRSGCTPASATVFESLALDGAGHPQLRRLSLRKPANSIKAFTQQRHSTLEI